MEVFGRNQALSRTRVAGKMLLALDPSVHGVLGPSRQAQGPPRLLLPQSIRGRPVTSKVLLAVKEAEPGRRAQ